MASLIRLRVVKPMEYFVDIEAVARIFELVAVIVLSVIDLISSKNFLSL